MSIQHTVLPGEHLAGIAAANGFAQFMTIWNDPANAELRRLRHNPNILLPGDIVTIPDKVEKVEQGATGQRAVFALDLEPLVLRIRLEDLDGKPIAGKACVLRLAGRDENGREALAKQFDLKTDGAGKLEQGIQETAGVAELTFDADKIFISIGGLDPVGSKSGMQARLNNLGYFAGFPLHEDEQLRWAVEEFQHDHDITPPNGDVDDPNNRVKMDLTKKTLARVHGDNDLP
jgi:hypothetical protein